MDDLWIMLQYVTDAAVDDFSISVVKLALSFRLFTIDLWDLDMHPGGTHIVG